MSLLQNRYIVETNFSDNVTASDKRIAKETSKVDINKAPLTATELAKIRREVVRDEYAMDHDQNALVIVSFFCLTLVSSCASS